MKLHLPPALRSALLVACAVLGFATADERKAYWEDFDGNRYDIGQVIDFPDLGLEGKVDSFVLENCFKQYLVDEKDQFLEEGLGGAFVMKDLKSEKSVISANTVSIYNNSVYGSGDNYVCFGGAIFVADTLALSFSDCGDVIIANNCAHGTHVSKTHYSYTNDHNNDDVYYHGQGGAIIFFGIRERSVLEFKGNENVFIRGNYVSNDSISYLNALSTKNADLAFAAKADQKVECYDGLDVDGTLWINTTNPLYRNENETFSGTVIISGEHAEEDISDIKWSEATSDEIYLSQHVWTEAVYVADGTLVLKDIQLYASQDISYSSTKHDHLFYSTPQAEVQLTNVFIITGYYDSGWKDEYGWENEYDVALKPHTLNVEQLGTVILPRATFTGVNYIRANYVNAENGVWTFNVGAENTEDALLIIDLYDTGDIMPHMEHGLYTSGATFHIQLADGLESGKYRLLEFNSKYGQWVGRDAVTLAGEAVGSIMEGGMGDVYFTIDKNQIFTLWFDNSVKWNDEEELPDNPMTPAPPTAKPSGALTWIGGDYDVWADGVGDGAWSAEREDKVFHNGDSVMFDNGGEVQVRGVVRPSSIVVNVESGETLSFDSEWDWYYDETSTKGQISGNTGIIKEGEGSLYICMSNAYTGDTIIKAGTLYAESEDAFGLGEVKLLGGGLVMSGAIRNNIYASGEDIYISGREYFAGNLTLDAATLRGNITIQKGSQLVVNGASTLRSFDLTLHEGSIVKVREMLTLGSTYSTNTLTTEGLQTISGNVTLNNCTLTLGNTLTIEGELHLDSTLSMELNTDKLKEEGVLTVIKADHIVCTEETSFELLNLEGTRATVKREGSSIIVNLHKRTFTWEPGSSGTWGLPETSDEWNSSDELDNDQFCNFDDAVFKCDKGELNDVNIVDNVEPSSINVNGQGDTIFNGDGHIIGNGKLTKEGSGKLIINNDNSDYCGDIEVKGGTLAVGNDYALGKGSAVVVHDGATFDGGNNSIFEREISMNGKSTLRFANKVSSLRFESGSEVHGTGFKLQNTLTIGSGGAKFVGDFHFAQSGWLKLTGGTFTIAGKVTHDAPMTYDNMGYYSARSWYGDEYEYAAPAVTTIDVSDWHELYNGGEFTLMKLHLEDGVDINQLFELYFGESEEGWNLERLSELEYVDDTLVVRIIVSGLDEDILATITPNQSAVYNTLESIRKSGDLKGELAHVRRMMMESENPAEVRDMLDRLSGEELATAMTSQLEGNMAHLRRLRTNMGSGQRIDGEGKNTAYIIGYDGQNHVDADGSAPGMKRTEWGGTVGFERCMREKGLIGIALTSGSATVHPTRGQSYDEDALRVDIYAVANFEKGWQNILSVGFGKHDFSITRHLPGGYTASSSPVGYSVNFQDEVSYTKQLNENNSIQSFAAIEVSANVIPAFSESGAGTASLESHDYATSAVDITLGVRYIRSFEAGGRKGQASVQAGLVKSLGENAAEMELNFAGAPERRFKVSAASTDAVGFTLGAGLLYPLSKHAAITASANAILRSGSEETGASVGIRLTF